MSIYFRHIKTENEYILIFTSGYNLSSYVYKDFLKAEAKITILIIFACRDFSQIVMSYKYLYIYIFK